jgi:hypothetical protein
VPRETPAAFAKRIYIRLITNDHPVRSRKLALPTR